MAKACLTRLRCVQHCMEYATQSDPLLHMCCTAASWLGVSAPRCSNRVSTDVQVHPSIWYGPSSRNEALHTASTKVS